MKTSHSTIWKWGAGLSLALGLCLAAPQAQAQYSGAGTFTKITSRADLTVPGYYVIADSTAGFAMNNSATSFFGSVAISPVGGTTLTDPATSIVWLIQTNATYGGLSLYNEAKSIYVAGKSANNAYPVPSVAGTTSVWSFAWASTVFQAALVADATRYLQYNSGSPRFASYTGTQRHLTLFKMGASGPTAPAVATVAASGIGTTTATANGNVTADGGATVTERGVCYKTSAGVALTDNKTAAAAGGTGTYSVDLSSLSVNQIYYFKAYASNSVGETLAANELNFTTLANVPAAPTVNNPTASTLDVAVNENSNPSSTEFAIQCTNNSQYVQSDGSLGASAVWATKSVWGTKTVTGLSASTTYGFQVKARNGASVETAFGAVASESTSAAPTGIWINPMSAGAPMATYYLGDTLGEWFVNFEIGQTWWDYAQLGIGTSADGTGYNWGEAIWYQDGEGDNKRVRRNLSGFQFTSAANYYVICQAKAYSGDAYTSKSGNGWGNSQAYPPADLASAYFAVSAINDPSGQSADADQSSQINLLWSNNAQNHAVMVVRKLAAASWTEPTQGTSYSASDTLGAGTVVYKGSAGVFYDTGLSASTTYTYKFYSVNNDYYSAGVTAEETTLACEPDAPAGLYAGETNETGFTATWTAAARATGYRLDVSTEEAFGVSSPAADLFISEYIEGTSNNKAVEIFNGTASAVDLSAGGYTLRVYANGGTSPTTISLTGTVAAGGVHVVAHSSANAAILAQADQTSGSLTQNGNDQIALAKNSVNIDVIGTIGLNVTNLIDVTKVRKSAVDAGVTTYDEAEWDNYAADTTSYLGSHEFSNLTPSFVPGYENLAVAGTSQAVTGLTDNTTYYFRVRAEGEGGCPSVNSATASVTTLETVGGPQTIDFPAIGAQVTTNVVVLSATASSGLDVSFAVLSGPASLDVDGVTLSFTGTGDVSVVASQAGGGGWDPADPVTNTFNVTKALATVTLGDLAQTYDGTPHAASVTTVPEGLTVDVTYDGGATPPTAPGSYAVVATVVDDLYQGSDSDTLTVSVADPASFSATAAGLTAIDLAFAANAAGNDVVIVANQTGTFGVPSGTPPAAGEAFADGIVVYAGTSSPQTHAGLSSCTPYYYKAWSQVDGYYSAGLTDDATTAAPAAPTGLGAVADYTGFAASWEASAGATGYRLDVSTEADFQTSAAGGLFISEAADPFDVPNAKFVELYNSTDAAIDLGAGTWYLWRQANGGSWTNVQLTGTIAAGGTYVVANSATYDSTFGKAANQYSSLTVSGNGDDGYFLVQGGSAAAMGTVVDAFGVVNQDGTGYAWEYLDKNAVRNADVAVANATWTASEWTIPAGTVNAAAMTPGAHVCEGAATPSFVAGYENLAVAGTSQSVTGLTEGVTYYFRVRAEGDSCTSADSATASTTTLEHLRAVITPATVNVREGGEGRFFVRLNQDPGGVAEVAVSHSSGDAGIAIQGAATTTLTFRSSNWSAWQAVTLTATEDANAASETATFLVALAGESDVFAEAATLDDEIGDNLAAAAVGTTLSAWRGYRLSQLIDGVHAVSTNYAFTTWTSVPPGTITLDLQATTVVSRVRILTWDWNYRDHLYTIESSLDGTSWSTVVDASTGAHRGWEDWAIGDVQARYLRLTGLTNTVNAGFCASELEVYGARLQTPALEFSTANVLVREAGEGRLFVRMIEAPEGNLAVNVALADGDADVALQGPTTLIFKPSNWAIWQGVTLTAGADENAANETGSLQVSTVGAADQFVDVEVLDDDIGENVALAAGGATLTAWRGYRLADAIDGVHAVMTNYAFTTCTSVPPGTLTLDMQTAMTVSRVRILTWDWDYRDHRYTIESSADGASWSMLADASAGAHRGWEDWAVADAQIRYLRFTGLTNSVNPGVCVPELEVYGTRPLPELIQLSKTSVNVRESGQGRFFVRLASQPAANVAVSVVRSGGDASISVQSGASLTFKPSNWSTWQVVTLAQGADENADGETATIQVSMPGVAPRTVLATALDDDIGENLALASAGATMTGRKAYYMSYVIDGIHTVLNQYGYTIWTNVPPGTMTLDLGSAANVSRVRILNWDWTYRAHQYLIESSADGETWSTLADASMGAHHGWEDWAAGGETIRYLRFTGLSNSANTSVCLSELEVIGTRVVGRRALNGAAASEESEPVAVLTSAGPKDETGWNAVDGDEETAWVGQAGGGYLVVEYQPTLTLSGLEVDVAAGALDAAQVLTSLDAKDWQPLPEDLEANPVDLNFLWLVFPDDGSAAAPEVIEIRPNP